MVSFKRVCADCFKRGGIWWRMSGRDGMVPVTAFCGHSMTGVDWLLDHGAVDVYATGTGLFPVYERRTTVPSVRRVA